MVTERTNLNGHGWKGLQITVSLADTCDTLANYLKQFIWLFSPLPSVIVVHYK